MVALVFSIISFLACVFLIYVLAQFHRELARGKGLRRLETRRAVAVMAMPVKQPAGFIGVWGKQAS
ncbi:MAG: hypothetical protein ACLQMT_03440 [Candidatus Acidiferrales bacterium]